MPSDKPPCPTCGNPDWCMISFTMVPGRGVMEVCEQCDPMNRIKPVPDYVCPYNDVHCMDEIRNGIRSMCMCIMYPEDSAIDTAFCNPNRTLIEHLRQKNPNRLINILTSEKLKRKHFVCLQRIDNQYKVEIVRQ